MLCKKWTQQIIKESTTLEKKAYHEFLACLNLPRPVLLSKESTGFNFQIRQCLQFIFANASIVHDTVNTHVLKHSVHRCSREVAKVESATEHENIISDFLNTSLSHSLMSVSSMNMSIEFAHTFILNDQVCQFLYLERSMNR